VAVNYKNKIPSIIIFAKAYDAYFYPANTCCNITFVDNIADVNNSIIRTTVDAIILDIDFLELDESTIQTELAGNWGWLPIISACTTNTLQTNKQLEHQPPEYLFDKSTRNPKELAYFIQNAIESYCNLQHKGIPLSDIPTLFSSYNELVFMATKTLKATTFPEALVDLAEKINAYCPDTVSGILFNHKNELNLNIYSHSHIAEDTAKSLQKQLLNQYNKFNLSQASDNDILLNIITNNHTTIEAEANSITTFQIPVLADNTISSILLLGCNCNTPTFHLLKLLSRYIYEMLHVIRDFRAKIIHDNLTGLFNHSHLYTKLQDCWRTACCTNTSLSFMMLDLDKFKQLNDSYGHKTGDSIINEFGRLIYNLLDSKGFAARYGGDEIAIILPNTDSNNARKFADNILQTTKSHIFKDSGHPLQLTVSVGYATSDTLTIKNELELLEYADKALYLAKKSGRNQSFDAATLATNKQNTTTTNTLSLSPGPSANKNNGHILVVDDDAQIIDILNRLLHSCNYSVTSRTNPTEALKFVKQNPDAIDVIISDINMPMLNGIELVGNIKDIDSNIVIIIISGYASSENTIAALRAGVFNFIQKPFNIQDIKMTVARAVEQRRLKRQLQMYHLHTEELLQDRTQALQMAVDNLKESYVKTMEAIVNTLDIHETSAALHSERVGELSVILAKELGITDKGELETIRYGALLHDIGKIGIPNNILKKPDVLTDSEMEHMKKHVTMGYNIVKTIPILQNAAEIVLSHHERFDGTGYPKGLSGKEICIGARIFMIADTYDALRDNRCYQASQSIDFIINEINSCSGTHFDPEVVKAFNNCFQQWENVYTKQTEAKEQASY
jgi:diguanylate cyclase (GGDEF)-like protein/putative nucleotidyltransferase with HDIG domain